MRKIYYLTNLIKHITRMYYARCTYASTLRLPKDTMFDWFRTVDFTRFLIIDNIVTAGCSSCLHHWFTSYSGKDAESMSKLWHPNEGCCTYITLFRDIYDPSCSNLPYLRLRGGESFRLASYPIYCAVPHALTYKHNDASPKHPRPKCTLTIALSYIRNMWIERIHRRQRASHVMIVTIQINQLNVHAYMQFNLPVSMKYPFMVVRPSLCREFISHSSTRLIICSPVSFMISTTCSFNAANALSEICSRSKEIWFKI